MVEKIEEIVEMQGNEMIALNLKFYKAMENPNKEERKKISRDILKNTEVLEQECIELSWIPFLYSIIARCYFDLGDIEKSIAYARDGLFLGELEPYQNKTNLMDTDTSNLHPLKTQRDISLGINDFKKAIELQERIVKVTPYKRDEDEMMVFLQNLLNSGREFADGAFMGFCEQIKMKTHLRNITTEEAVKTEKDIRVKKILGRLK